MSDHATWNVDRAARRRLMDAGLGDHLQAGRYSACPATAGERDTDLDGGRPDRRTGRAAALAGAIGSGNFYGRFWIAASGTGVLAIIAWRALGS